jgi:predicted ATPase
VVRWAARRPEARVIVTARRRPAADGEVALRLDGLPIDDGLALFVAQARRLGVEPAARELDLVREIVALVDGLPLAIVYAAWRAVLLPIPELLEAVRTGRAALGGDDGDPRHRTLRRAVGWTWGQLAPWEQAAVAQLSVFEGGFDLEMAAAALDLSAFADGPDPLEALQVLCDRSVLRRAGRARWEVYRAFREFQQDRAITRAVGRG